MRAFCAVLLLVASFDPVCYGYHILGVFHTISESQFLAGSALMKELAAWGHQVTVVSPFRLVSPVKNYNEIVLEGVLEKAQDYKNGFRGLKSSTFVTLLPEFYEAGYRMTANTLQHPTFQKLLESEASFDLVVLDTTANEAMLGLGQHFNSLIVGCDTSGMKFLTYDYKAQPVSLVTKHLREPIIRSANFNSRLLNIFAYAWEMLYFNYKYLPRQEALYKEYFSEVKTPLGNLRDVSVLILNRKLTDIYEHYQKIIETEDSIKAASQKQTNFQKNMQAFLDSSTHGVIYISFEMTNRNLSNETLKRIITDFSKRKENIVWKSNERERFSFPNNILVATDISESSIIAHPKVKLVICDGEMSTILRAAYNGAPIIGITQFYDQSHNLALARREGAAIDLNLMDLEFTDLNSVVTEVLSNSIYTDAAKAISKRLQNPPLRKVESTASWAEFLAKNRGFSSTSKISHQSFIAENNADVVTCLVLFCAVWIYGSYRITKKLLTMTVLLYLNYNVKEKQS